MKLYLVQHGEALPDSVDPERPVSEKGRAGVLKTANFLKDKVIPDIIWHSDKLRAKQTAEIFAGILPSKNGITEKQGLGPNDPVENIKSAILHENLDSLMIVGHLPFMSRLASLLLSGSESRDIQSFRNGGVVCLERTGKEWSAVWAVVPDLIGE